MPLRPTGIKETCFYARDLARMKEFYHELLGLPVIHHKPDEHLFLRAGRDVLLCFNAGASRGKTSPPPHYGSGDLHFAFEVPRADYEAAKTLIQRLGIAIEDELEWPGGGLSFYFRDPENNCLEVVMPGIWGD